MRSKVKGLWNDLDIELKFAWATIVITAIIFAFGCIVAFILWPLTMLWVAGIILFIVICVAVGTAFAILADEYNW